MNLLIESESTPEIPCMPASRMTLMSSVIAHAVLFTAIMAVQVGMLAQAVTPHAAAAAQVA